MTTGEKIYELRKKARITQEDFADKLGVTHQAVSKWESNTAFPETETIIKIAEMFGVSCDYLLKNDAVQHDNLIDYHRRSFLSMMVSFAIAACIAGYIVALICYCVINKHSNFIGFGILTGFLLIGFILWSVGRYLFLSKCDWADADKQHLAKLTTAFLFTAIITFFCYLPAIITGINIVSTLAYTCVGIAVAMLVQMIHRSTLGEKIQTVHLVDSICFCVCALSSAGIFTGAIYARFHPIIHGDEDITLLIPVLIFSIIVTIALISQSVVRRKVYKTPNFLFSVQITGGVFISLNGAVFFISHFYYFEGGSLILYWTFAALLFVVAVLQIILSANYAKRGKENVLSMMLHSLPFCVFMWCMQIGCYYFLEGASTLLYLQWLLVVLNLYMATLQIAQTIKTKLSDKQS